MNGIFTIDYVKKRADMAGKLTKIDIYSGFVNPANRAQNVVKIQEIRPDANKDFRNVWEFFQNTTFGDFTAVFFPSKEIIYFSNKGEVLNGSEEMAYIPTEEQINAQVQRVLEIERLKNKIAQLEEEREHQDEIGSKFGTAITILIEKLMGGNSTPVNIEPVLNGSENLNETENALAVIVAAFGEDWVVKFANKVQREPHIVPQIKNFFS
jgi:hypothetical protein